MFTFLKIHWRWGPVSLGVSTGIPLLFADATRGWGEVALATGLAVSIILVLPALGRAASRNIARSIVAEAFRAEGVTWPPVVAPHPPPVVPARPSPTTELGVALAGMADQRMRSNVQHLLDQLDDVRGILSDAVEQGRYWQEELPTGVWEAVRPSLMSEPGFHLAYAPTRQAHKSIALAASLCAARGKNGRLSNSERATLRDVYIPDIDAATRALTSFLGYRP